jgi:short-subunit dehydrogenase
MKIALKPLAQQVIVLTGASSGIGLVTARKATEQGATLVLAARSEEALRHLTHEIIDAGGRATYVVADVSREDDVRRLAQTAIDTYGGFDTWINNAGVSMYGKLEEQPVADMRALFDTNVWGLVVGSLEAVKHLKAKGGALINVGSILSESTAILQSIYSASKHAVKGFTDGLRMELGMDEAPVSVSLIKPSAIDTPYPLHAKNYMDREAQHAPPAYAPELVAQAILHCCTTPTPEVTVGGGGKLITSMARHTPRLLDVFMEKVFAKQEKTDYPPRPLEQNGLDRPSGQLQERGNYTGHTRETSLYTAAALHPLTTAAVLAGGAALLALWASSRRSSSTQTGDSAEDADSLTGYYDGLRRW